MRPLLCLALLWATLLSAHAAPPPPASPSLLCEAAILNAERTYLMPRGMLGAIGMVESGRPDAQTGALRPWPWTINANGVGQFFATKAQAMAAVKVLQAQGVHSIDVGCMQINLAYHPDAFVSLAAAFDPPTNAAYAVRFLRELFEQTHDWPRSVAAYHSNTPQIAADYQRRVQALWRQPVAPGSPGTLYVLNGLLFGKIAPSGRVYGLIQPSVPNLGVPEPAAARR